MPTLLYISSSPMGERSDSRAVADAFLEAYGDSHPGDVIKTIDLWHTSLPTFTPIAAAAKMAVLSGETLTGEQADVWRAIKEVADDFAAADRYLFSVPMWNHGLPYVLKHYLDTVTQPGITFNFVPSEGYRAVLTGKKAVGIYTSAGYHDGAPPSYSQDFASPHLKALLRIFGIDDYDEIKLYGLAVSAEPDEDRAAARAKARALGKVF